MKLVCDAVVFDLDGVLVDSSVVVERHWRRWAESHGIEYARVVAVMHGRRAAETVALVAPHLDALRESRKHDADEGRDTDGLRVFEGAVALLSNLPRERWGIATSGNTVTATTRLRFGNFPEPFALVTADDVRRGKPDPEAYLMVAERLGVVPAACVVVEDAPAGVAAAHAAGMRAVAVRTTHDPDALSAADAIVPAIGALRISGELGRLVISTPADWRPHGSRIAS
jgi:mannitol-1-/sugar-/sorbitol-6-phosphatase